MPFVFDVADGSLGEARAESDPVVSAIRFGFVTGGSSAPPAEPDRELACLLARGYLRLEPRIRLRNVERCWAFCPLCHAPMIAYPDGRTRCFTLEEEDEVDQETRRWKEGGPALLVSGELWIETETPRVLVAPTAVVHLVDAHGYHPPADLRALLLGA